MACTEALYKTDNDSSLRVKSKTVSLDKIKKKNYATETMFTYIMLLQQKI